MLRGKRQTSTPTRYQFLEEGCNGDDSKCAGGLVCIPSIEVNEVYQFDEVHYPLQTKVHPEDFEYLTTDANAVNAEEGYAIFRLHVKTAGEVTIKGKGASTKLEDSLKHTRHGYEQKVFTERDRNIYKVSPSGQTSSGADSDSFFVSVDGSEEYPWDGFRTNNFANWHAIGSFQLDKGMHELKVRVSEKELRSRVTGCLRRRLVCH